QFAHLDLRHLGEEKIMERLPFVRELATTYVEVDPVHEPIPIRPVLHYMMGGVETDNDGATTLDGLYAAGEVASVSINGANRLGSNSLTECLVFGARAGESAARFAAGASEGEERPLVAQAEEERGRIEALRGRRGEEKLADLRRELNLTMEAGTGVYREQASMQKAVENVAEIKRRFERVAVDDASKVFNTELVAALELRSMIDVAEAVSLAAVNRKESRGAHACKDHPTRNDQDYLHHGVVFWSPEGPRYEKKEVRMGIWEPEERKY
ncbi:MAG: FAD-binding protein, partial [Myxococcota bacterium]|nr:FAD-binding protein [Myxococcota bacterium]